MRFDCWRIAVAGVLTATLLGTIGCMSPGTDAEDAYEDVAPIPVSWPTRFDPTPVSTASANLMRIFEGDLLVAPMDFNHPEGGRGQVGCWNGTGWRRLGDLDRILGVTTLAEYRGQLYAGGHEGPAADREGRGPLAVWDGTAWRPVGDGIRGAVHALAVWNDLLVVGGRFHIDGFPRLRNLAAWDGSAWHEFPTNGLGGGDNAVQALAAYGGDLYVGGTFIFCGGVRAANLARWNGRTWNEVAQGTDGPVGHLVVFDDELVVGGDFRHAGGREHIALARWDGRRWSALGDPFAGYDEERSVRGLVRLLKPCDGKLYLAGRLIEPSAPILSGLAVWDGERWSGWLEQAETVRSPRAIESYRGELVMVFPETRPDRDGAEALFFQQPVVWRGDRWQRLDGPSPAIFNRQATLVLYGGEPVVIDRSARAGERWLEAWRGDEWQVLAALDDQPWNVPTKLYDVEVEGADLYVLGSRTEGDSTRTLVLHFDGDRVRRLGEPFDPPFDDNAELAVLDGRVTLLGRRMEGEERATNCQVLDWNGRQWEAVDSAPALDRVTAAIGFEDGLFVATSGPMVRGRPLFRDPEIWRRRGDEWKRIWRRDTGRVPFFQVADGSLWAGVSWAKLDRHAPAPLLKWETGKWRPVGSPLVATRGYGVGAQVQAMAVLDGKPLISCQTDDLAEPEHWPPREYTLQWDGRRWRRIPALDGGAGALLETGGRLWIGAPDRSGERPTPWTWHDGPFELGAAFAPDQIMRWHKLPSEQKVLPPNRGESIREELPIDPPVPGRILPGAGPEGEEVDAGWYGWTRAGREPLEEPQIDRQGRSLTSALLRYGKIGVNFPAERGAVYRATFDLALDSDSAPERSDITSSIKMALVCRSGGRRVDYDSGILHPEDLPHYGGRFQTISLAAAALGDSGYVNVEIDVRSVSRQHTVRIENLRIERDDAAFRDGFADFLSLMRERWVRPDGTRYPGSPVEAELQARADTARSHSAAEQVFGELRSAWRRSGILETGWTAAPDSLFLTRERVEQGNAWIADRLLPPGLARSVFGWLSLDTVYFRGYHRFGTGLGLVSQWPGSDLGNLDPETRIILDLRVGDADRAPLPETCISVLVQEWKAAIELAAALTDEPVELVDYEGSAPFLDDPALAAYVRRDPANPALARLVVPPAPEPAPRRRVVVLVNRNSHALTVQALKGRPGVTIIGEAARGVRRPAVMLVPPNGWPTRIPTGVIRLPGGEPIAVAGVKPDIEIPRTEDGDPAFEKALELLK